MTTQVHCPIWKIVQCTRACSHRKPHESNFGCRDSNCDHLVEYGLQSYNCTCVAINSEYELDRVLGL